MDKRRTSRMGLTVKLTVEAILSFALVVGLLVLLDLGRQHQAFGWAWGPPPDAENVVLRSLIINGIQWSVLFTRFFFRGLNVLTVQRKRWLYITYAYLLVLSWTALALKYFTGPTITKVSGIIGLIGFTGLPLSVYWYRVLIKVYRDVESRLNREQELSEQYYRQLMADPLTGLPNRMAFEKDLTEALEVAKREDRMLAVLYLDLDRFKMINDTLGHALGDLLLQEVAVRLHSRLESGETLYRMGGDEFFILREQASQLLEAERKSQQILQALEQPFVIKGHELFISASIGIAWSSDRGQDMATLYKNADMAMYRAKEQGRNTYQVHDAKMSAGALERLALENDLRKAIEREQFVVYYQPKVNIRTGEWVGMEALVRWQHPERGMIAPGEFIPLAEDTKLIVPLSEWVLRTACRQAKTWHDAGYPQMKVAVNVSPQQFQYTNLVATVRDALEQTGLDPAHLDLEITESVMMVNVERAITTMHDLADLGVRISIDDFGTGYSSLSYLQKFPIDTLKIDRSFVRDITSDADDAAIAAAILALAHSLQLNVVAEGVETEAQLLFLQAHHCDEMQGFYVSPPLPAEEFERLIPSALLKNIS